MNPTTVIDLYPVDDDRETGRLPPTAPAGFLEQFGPARGYAVETEVMDALSLQPGLRRLYALALRAGRTPAEMGLPAPALADQTLVCRATLRDDQGRVVATATAAQRIQTGPDLAALETAARQQLRAALGFGGAVREAGEALDPHAQGLAVPAVSVPAALPPAPEPQAPTLETPAPEPQAPVDDAALALLRRQLAHLARTRGVEPPAVATKAEAHAALQALLRPVAA